MYLLIRWVAEKRNFTVESIRRYGENIGMRFRMIDIKHGYADLRVLSSNLIRNQ